MLAIGKRALVSEEPQDRHTVEENITGNSGALVG